MKYLPEDYLHLRVVPNPENDCGFDVIETTSGRPVAGIVEIKVTKGVGTNDVRTQPPQKIELTLVGVPVALNLPDWNTYFRERHAKQQYEEVAKQRAEYLRKHPEAAAAEAATAEAVTRQSIPQGGDDSE